MTDSPRTFHCGCCQPPRQIYYQAALIGPARIYHEDDNTPAVPWSAEVRAQ